MPNAEPPPKNRLLLHQRTTDFGNALKVDFEQRYQGLSVRLADSCAATALELDAEPVDFCVLDLEDEGSADLYFDVRTAFPGTTVLLTSDRPPSLRQALPADDETRVVPVPLDCSPTVLCTTLGKRLGLEAAGVPQPPSRDLTQNGPPVPPQPKRLSLNRQIRLPDLVQIKCQSGRTCLLEIRADAHAGQIFFHKGNIMHAVADQLEGLPALMAIFGWKNGRFMVFPWREPAVRSIHHRWEAILLEIGRRADEAGPGMVDYYPESAAVPGLSHPS